MRYARHLIHAHLSAVSFFSAACGSDSTDSNSLDEPDNVRFWATTASAVGVYAHAYTPISFADGQSTFEDPACPLTTDDGTTVTITGGCTDQSGTEFIGSASVVRSATGDRTLTLDEYGSFPDPSWRAATTGTISMRQLAPTTHAFEVDVVQKGGMTLTIHYSGSVEGTYDTATTWNGSGDIERTGVVAPTGVINATTIDQVVDNSVCSGQPVSGQTTIANTKQTAVVTYDGATDCDGDQAARWSLDGQDRGLITGISCSVGAIHPNPQRYGVGAWLIAFILFGASARRRRTRIRSVLPFERPMTIRTLP